jgi:hypothetical protein
VALAFDFELGALDRQLRAEKILAAASGLHTENWTDRDFGRAIHAIERAFADLAHAELLEDVADSLRWKDFIERQGGKHAERNQAA